MGSGAFPLSPEPISGNSMTSYLRSLTNAFGQQGQQILGSGQGTLAQGLQDFQQPLQYYQDILSGNKSSMESAIAPEKASVLSKYRAARKSIQANNGRSGGTNEAVASSEFSQAGDIAGLLQKLRPQAAKGEADIASQIGSLGIEESGLGASESFQALSSLLTERGQDMNQQNANLSNLTSGLSSAFNSLMV